eukprot:3031615-Prymnesium_polylepis.2
MRHSPLCVGKCVDRKNTKGTNTRDRAGSSMSGLPREPAHAVPRARDPATGSGDLTQEAAVYRIPDVNAFSCV